MSFEKKEWEYKDTITADELNRIEDGIANGGALIVNENSTTEGDDTIYTLDKTWKEIYDAFASGKTVRITREAFIDAVISAGYDSSVGYSVLAGMNTYGSETESGYPSRKIEGLEPGPGGGGGIITS